MSKRATIPYALLLLMVLTLAAVVWGTGESLARYENTATWNTFVQPTTGETVSSDWLQPVGGEEIVILLGELTQPQEITVTLQSTEDVTGQLTWSTDRPDHLTVTCEAGADLALAKDQPATVVLTVSPTEAALNMPRETMTAHVTVNWNDTLTGRFRMVLPAVAEMPEEPAQGEEPEQQEPAEGEVQEEVQEPEETPQAAAVTVSTIPHFVPDGMLPVKVTATAGVTAVRLGLTDGQEMQPFPAGTKYRLDGESCMLYRDSVIELTAAEEGTAVQLDFSRTDITEGQVLQLMAEGSGEELLPGTATVQTTADVAQTVLPQQPVLTDKAAVELALPVQWKDYALTYTVEQLVLQADEQQTEQKIYVPVEDPEVGALRVRLADSETEWKLVLETGDTLPAAGTYRIVWKWTYEGMDFGETRTYFFINYLAQTIETEQTGGAEQ